MAAARGVIDFSASRPNDAAWWRRFWWLLDMVAVDNEARLVEAQQRHSLALVANGNLSDDGFARAQKQAAGGFQHLQALYRPWEGVTPADREARDRKTERDAYVRLMGDPNDPEVLARARQAAAEYEANKSAVKLNPQDTARQRMVARNQARRKR